MTDFKELINKSIKNLRLEKGLSQEKFAELCDINSDNYRNIEHNRHTPSAATVNKICDTFKITPVALLYYGCETSGIKEKVIGELNGLSDNQLKMLSEIISVIRTYKD